MLKLRARADRWNTQLGVAVRRLVDTRLGSAVRRLLERKFASSALLLGATLAVVSLDLAAHPDAVSLVWVMGLLHVSRRRAGSKSSSQGG